jgi:hypothetical protein
VCTHGHFYLAAFGTSARGRPGRLWLRSGRRGETCRREGVEQPGRRRVRKHVGPRRRGAIGIWIRRVRWRWIAEERRRIGSRGRWRERVRINGLLWSRWSLRSAIACHADVAEEIRGSSADFSGQDLRNVARRWSKPFEDPRTIYEARNATRRSWTT